MKTRTGEAKRLVDNWQPTFYVAGEMRDLISVARGLNIEGASIEEMYVDPGDSEKSEVLQVPVSNTSEASRLAEMIFSRYRGIRLFNVDVPSNQMYLYTNDIFPYGYAEARCSQGSLRWRMLERVEDTEYEVPHLESVELDVVVAREGGIAKMSDPIEKITVRHGDETVVFDGGGEADKLLSLVGVIQEIDPEIIYTKNGDGFVFPYLAERASRHGIIEEMVLGREDAPLIRWRHGQSYVSYGIVNYRPNPTRLLGRLHIDRENAMIYEDCGLEGVVEVARTCRIPGQRVVNSTIGTSMTSIQLYHAVRGDILIPWLKAQPEDIKTAEELLIADRGGLYYAPHVGIHENVGELDFTSLYPTLMLTKNLSAETVRCRCCPDSPNRVPELNYNICSRREGIVPRSLRLLLDKRAQYKRWKNETGDSTLRKRYDKRQAALKWILVCS